VFEVQRDYSRIVFDL